MNDKKIEELLRKAPSPDAPEGLLEKLTADIRVPRAAANPTRNWTQSPSWMRRWLPSLSFAGLFLACSVAIGVQTTILAALNRENEPLKARKQDLEKLRADNAEYQNLITENQELERLRKDNAELQKLRADVVQLHGQAVGAGKLAGENERIRQQLAANPGPSGTGPDAEAYALAQAKAERIQCVNNLKQVGLAARLWSGDNGDFYPPNFICMTNEMSTWKILQCPSDKSRHVTSWGDVAAGNISYLMIAPGIKEGGPDYAPNIVFVECSIHHNVCLVDGSVQQLSDARYNSLKIVNGRKVMPQ